MSREDAELVPVFVLPPAVEVPEVEPEDGAGGTATLLVG